MARPQDDHLWALAHAERAALAKNLAGLGAEQWRHDTLCGEWDVEQAVAHLTAAASLNQRQWLRSMAGARFPGSEPLELDRSDVIAAPDGITHLLGSAGPKSTGISSAVFLRSEACRAMSQ